MNRRGFIQTLAGFAALPFAFCKHLHTEMNRLACADCGATYEAIEGRAVPGLLNGRWVRPGELLYETPFYPPVTVKNGDQLHYTVTATFDKGVTVEEFHLSGVVQNNGVDWVSDFVPRS